MSTALLYAGGVAVFMLAIYISIGLHEVGHLVHAKKFGCRVTAYMIGFGPTLWSRKADPLKGRETEYGLKLIPLGGYVKIIGMFPPESGVSVNEAVLKARDSKQQRDAKIAQLQRMSMSGGAGSTVTVPNPRLPDEYDEAPTSQLPEQLRLRKSNTGMFAQLVSRSRSAEFELVDADDIKNSRLFFELPARQKVMVMFAGPAVNLVLAFLSFLAVFSIYGVHETEPTGSTVITRISDCVIAPENGAAAAHRTTCEKSDPLTPAKAAGLRPGDQILSFNNQSVEDWDHLSALIHDNGSEPMRLKVRRPGHDEMVVLKHVNTVEMERDVDEDGDTESVGYLGAQAESREVVTHRGPIYTLQQMGDMTIDSIKSVVQLPAKVWNVAQAITGSAERDADSPMSVIGGSRLAGEVASSDAPGLDVPAKLALLGLIIGIFNLFLGVFNLIPLLPLDGGHIAGAVWEGARRHGARLLGRGDPGPVDTAKMLPVAHVVGFVFLVMGVVLILGDILVPLETGL